MTSATLSRLIQSIDQADSAQSLLNAVEALAEARLEAAIPTLIAVLSYNNPGAAVAAVEGLVQLGDVAVLPLLNLMDDYNYGGRAWAIRALAGIADPRALETLITAAETDFAMSVRRAAVKGLGNLRWSQLLAEEIEPTQRRVLQTLRVTCQDSEWVVRYASVVALQALATAMTGSQTTARSEILEHLEQIVKTETDLTVCTRIQLALTQLKHAPIFAF